MLLLKFSLEAIISIKFLELRKVQRSDQVMPEPKMLIFVVI